MKSLCLLLLLLCTANRAAAQAAQTERLTIPRVSAPPTLEDYLDGVPRPDEAAITTFVQREPGDGVPASQPTGAYVSYDDTYLYVMFIARDREPQQVRASLTKRESFGNDDFVGVALDTFRDRRRAYLFIVNPLGVQLDGVSTDGEELLTSACGSSGPAARSRRRSAPFRPPSRPGTARPIPTRIAR